MVLSSFQNIKISGNTFINMQSRKRNYAERGSISVKPGKNAVFIDYKYQRSPFMSEEFVEADPGTTDNIKIIQVE